MPLPYTQLTTSMYPLNVYVSTYPPYLTIHPPPSHARIPLHTSHPSSTCAPFKKEVFDFG